ncbi:RcnB family protein [Pseudomonas sp. NPDC007930]|uniref:RcnB family protein n=1 Tax=Pseudomonas sp. NPDC007930 TaxID=3364417 RepID=UPI0036EF1627
MSATVRKVVYATLASAVLALGPQWAHADNEKPADCQKNEVFMKFLDHTKCYGTGDKVPDPNSRDEVALKDWKNYKLPAPKENTQWVKSGDHFLLINRENATIVEIYDKAGHKVE